MFGLGSKSKSSSKTVADTGPAWPTEIIGNKAERHLYVAFDSGESGTIEAELLRVMSPSAEVKGHGPGPGVLVRGKENVSITNLEPVGNYAVRIIFDDGHSTGLYTWSYLHDLLRNKTQHWTTYHNRLAAG